MRHSSSGTFLSYIQRFILLIEWIFGSHDLKSCVLSIVIGHSLYFVYNVYPKMRFVENKEFFDTPNFLYAFCYMNSVRAVAPLFNEEHAHRNNQEDEMFLWGNVKEIYGFEREW